ncbi:hypothetical protein [Paenarthrobacter nitroguajacolicus]|uniref:hypothetical protein n=1 Tax=Paenarthrobacter nitroguajacolicus TaxID=211146 RepID=UPI00248C51E7|nr:hypothetical protein [Paenarthrobacter nitroguajacolicus]MDI2037146.1 hypothetical protein [Paenarthrobacter nitroguajacolicus]
MLITSESAAGEALEEVGQLQRSAEDGNLAGGHAGDQMVERADAVVEYFLAMGSSNLYGPLIEPLMQWAQFAMAPIWLRNPETQTGREAKQVYESIRMFFEKYSHLQTTD